MPRLPTPVPAFTPGQLVYLPSQLGPFFEDRALTRHITLFGIGSCGKRPQGTSSSQGATAAVSGCDDTALR